MTVSGFHDEHRIRNGLAGIRVALYNCEIWAVFIGNNKLCRFAGHNLNVIFTEVTDVALRRGHFNNRIDAWNEV